MRKGAVLSPGALAWRSLPSIRRGIAGVTQVVSLNPPTLCALAIPDCTCSSCPLFPIHYQPSLNPYSDTNRPASPHSGRIHAPSSPYSISPSPQVRDNDHAPASPRNPHPSQGLHAHADWPQAHSPAPWTVPGAQSITSTRPGERQLERDWGALTGGRGLSGPPHPPYIKDRAHPAVALSPSVPD